MDKKPIGKHSIPSTSPKPKTTGFKAPTTSWGNEATWYEDHLKNPDSYHKKVILPNVLRIMDVAPSDTILDRACGTGFFASAFLKAKKVIGVDIGKELINIAKKNIPTAT
jgi:tRNA/tmRNA/rRNA uracil-C5-methylase (TrmA/RlmC/RlmD family)